MKRRTHLVSMLGLGSALLLSSAVYAQAPGGPGAPPPAPAAPGAPGGADAGGITNETTTTTTTTTSDIDTNVATDDSSTLPNTGGAPWLMALAGSATAGSALLMRRKLS